MTANKKRKKLGQHFLVDEHVIVDIVGLINADANETIVEIGPGRGALTRHLARPDIDFHAIEIDPKLVRLLNSEFSDDQLVLHHADALKFDFSSVQRENRKLRIVGNLPYSISTPLLLRMAQYADIIQDMCLMVQYEVAARLTAECGTRDYGRLTVSVGRTFSVESVFNVSPDAFSPPPEVRSTVMYLRTRKLPKSNSASDDMFSDLVRLAFGNRRKTLRNSLGRSIDESVFNDAGIDANLRAQNLGVEHYIRLADCAILNNAKNKGNVQEIHD